MMDEKVTLPSGEEISKDFYDKLKSVKGKRARFVIDKIIQDGSCSTEDLKDAGTKIAYLEELKTIASSCSDGGTFRAEVKKRYPAYSGENYLDMTSGFFFP